MMYIISTDATVSYSNSAAVVAGVICVFAGAVVAAFVDRKTID